MDQLKKTIQDFTHKSEENRIQASLLCGFILTPILAMLALFIWVLF